MTPLLAIATFTRRLGVAGPPTHAMTKRNKDSIKIDTDFVAKSDAKP